MRKEIKLIVGIKKDTITFVRKVENIREGRQRTLWAKIDDLKMISIPSETAGQKRLACKRRLTSS